MYEVYWPQLYVKIIALLSWNKTDKGGCSYSLWVLLSWASRASSSLLAEKGGRIQIPCQTHSNTFSRLCGKTTQNKRTNEEPHLQLEDVQMFLLSHLCYYHKVWQLATLMCHIQLLSSYNTVSAVGVCEGINRSAHATLVHLCHNSL